MGTEFDLVILGGGMVGATLACALQERGLKIAVIEATPPSPFAPEQPHDLRVSALSPASQRILVNLGAWEGIRARRLCPYRHLRVWERRGWGDTRFDSDLVAQPVLGHIVENRVIQLALWDRLREGDVTLLSPTRVDRIDYDPEGSQLLLDDGQRLATPLLVGADGGNSRVRQAAGIGVHSRDYYQHALVACVETAAGQQDITWQQFLPSGPLAFLPLSGHQGSLVWYQRPDEVRRLLALSDGDFIDAVQAAFPAELGPVHRVHARASFPLKRQHALSYHRPGAVLVGDAAHIIHPLAGQGVNIGLLDAACLAEVLLAAHDEGRSLADSTLLETFERRRRPENLAMMTAMDLIYHVFDRDDPVMRLVRNLGLGLAERLSPAKKLAAGYAMGGRSLPALAREGEEEHAERTVASL